MLANRITEVTSDLPNWAIASPPATTAALNIPCAVDRYHPHIILPNAAAGPIVLRKALIMPLDLAHPRVLQLPQNIANAFPSL